MSEKSKLGKWFSMCNHIFLIALSLLCLFPFLHILALSFSSRNAVVTGSVSLWPVEFTLDSYAFIMRSSEFMTSFGITLERVVLGTVINLLLTIMIAYPLSKNGAILKGRTVYAWFFVFTILFSGGLVPWYMTIRYTGLLDSLWALILPGAVPVFNVILLLNFFRGLPKELEEAAFIDGAGHWTVLWKIFVPTSKPAISTISLFTIVGHWNSWFDGLILMNSPDHYPLSSYLQKVLTGVDLSNMQSVSVETLKMVSNRTAKAAQIVLAALPILMLYPFLQKYFTKGIVLGSVKE